MKNTMNKGGQLARKSVIAKLRRLKARCLVSGGVDAVEVINQLIEWVNMSASRYQKRPGGLGPKKVRK